MITLTTDFALADPFVGMMKGAILTINPSATIVDITHGIPAHDIMRAALVIAGAFRYFPNGTVHVAVVDPGVGSGRRRIIASAHGHRFVGPDNGIFTLVLATDPRARVFEITGSGYFLQPYGSTFEGRDVFAPVAAWLDKGKDITELGAAVDDWTRIEIPSAKAGPDMIVGEVIYIDGFGNAITNISAAMINALGGTLRVFAKSTEATVVRCYQEGSCSMVHALINSDGLLELFVDRGSAASTMGLKVGDDVRVERV